MRSRFEAKFSDAELSLLIQTARRQAARWCGSAADAEDIAQEAVLRLIRQAQTPDNIITWLFVVTRRLAHRRMLRERTRTGAEQAFSETHMTNGLRVELVLDVGGILSRLKEKDARLLTDVAEGKSSLEISAGFGCSIGNVGQMVARAREKARRLRDEHKRRE
ncbi:MAG TPA: RNA polymerase sigma factor [Thermoanaerobaculia bacterium]|nr:RNA polymerase sigma factor [Thermoanaerobaculia bacterium]